MKSPQYGHPVHAEMATGYGPCRLCLQTFRVGTDERLLVTYQPFADPEALRPLPLAFDGYGANGVLFVQRRVGMSSFEAVLEGGSARRRQPAEGPYGGGAVTAEHEGKVAGRASLPNLDSQTWRQLEGGSDFSGPVPHRQRRRPES